MRITPLTDSDIDETAEELNCEKETCVKETLGRVSQMIEEIPWLWELEFDVLVGVDSIHIANPTAFLKTGAAKRPAY